MQDAIHTAQTYLANTRLPGSGWGYYPGSLQAFPEPTCYSLLALAGASFASQEPLDWLTGLVNETGQLRLPNDKMPNWGTSHLVIALTRLGERPTVRQASVDWLVEWSSQPSEPTELIPIDTRLIGWSWISDTFSWVEPTAYAVFALKLSGLEEHARVKEAERLLFDRMCPRGGWNFGNPRVLENEIDASLTETAIAVFALQDLPEAAAAIQQGLDILEERIFEIPSTLSLALMILALDLFDRPVESYVQALLRRQSGDGSWKQETWWTALSVLAVQAAAGGANVFRL